MAWAPPDGEKSDQTQGDSVESRRRQGVGPRPLAGAGVHELLGAGDVGDAPVPQGHQVLDGGHDAGAVVDGDHGPTARDRGRGDHHTRETQRLEQVGPGVVDPQVGEEHAVDPTAGGERLVVAAFGLLVRDDLQEQGLAALGQRHLDAGDEGGEERVGAERLRVPGDHQTDGQSPRRGQRPSPMTGGEAELGGDRQDPGPGGIGHARTVVQRERDRTSGDARRTGDVGDCGAGHTLY